jgi:peroxidase
MHDNPISSSFYLLVRISVLNPKKKKKGMKCSFSFGFLLILVLPLILASAQDGKYERAAYHDNYEGAVQKDQDYEGQYQDQEKGPAKYDQNYEKERTPAQNDQHYDQEEQDYHVPSLEISTLLDNLPSDDLLSIGYYSKSCPKAESIINKHVTKWVEEDRTLAASLLRLHFHDCAVHVRIPSNCFLRLYIYFV